MAGLVIVLALSLGGCVPFIGGREQSRQLAAAAQDLVGIVEAQEGEVDWLACATPLACKLKRPRSSTTTCCPR